jgi:hypothetical protein
MLSPALHLVTTDKHDEQEVIPSSVRDAVCIPLGAGNTSLQEYDLQPNKIELNQLLPHLQQLDDNALQNLAFQATRLEQYAFRLRGAIASEMRRRLALRPSGGRGRHDHQSKGIRSCLRQLAVEIGVSIVTLTTDARIHDVFFTHNEETVIARDNSLPREYYVIALAAPDPLAAIRMAEEQAASNGSTREEFRRYVRELKRSANTQAVGVNTTEAPVIVARTVALTRQQVLVTGGARYTLNELMKASNCTAEQIVADALIAHYRLLVESISDATTVKSPAARRSRRTTTDDDALRQVQPLLLADIQT